MPSYLPDFSRHGTQQSPILSEKYAIDEIVFGINREADLLSKNNSFLIFEDIPPRRPLRTIAENQLLVCVCFCYANAHIAFEIQIFKYERLTSVVYQTIIAESRHLVG